MVYAEDLYTPKYILYWGNKMRFVEPIVPLSNVDKEKKPVWMDDTTDYA